MKDITREELDAAPRDGEHYLIRGAAYHLYVIYECFPCTEGRVCLWKHSIRHPKKRTLMLICGEHTTCEAAANGSL